MCMTYRLPEFLNPESRWNSLQKFIFFKKLLLLRTPCIQWLLGGVSVASSRPLAWDHSNSSALKCLCVFPIYVLKYISILKSRLFITNNSYFWPKSCHFFPLLSSSVSGKLNSFPSQCIFSSSTSNKTDHKAVQESWPFLVKSSIKSTDCFFHKWLAADCFLIALRTPSPAGCSAHNTSRCS